MDDSDHSIDNDLELSIDDTDENRKTVTMKINPSTGNIMKEIQDISPSKTSHMDESDVIVSNIRHKLFTRSASLHSRSRPSTESLKHKELQSKIVNKEEKPSEKVDSVKKFTKSDGITFIVYSSFW